MPLSASRQRTLDALARVVVPTAYERAETAQQFNALLLRRLEGAPTGVNHDLGIVLDVFGSRLAALLVSRRLRPVASLPETERAEAFAGWGTSAIGVARTAHQAIRQFVISTYYTLPEARARIGVRPPLHTRMPAVSWEGPVPGERTLDSEPVARVPRGTFQPPSVPDGKLRPGITLGSAVRGDLRITADVIIVGSGAGGAVAAARLAEAGREVVILESGEYLDADDFNEIEADMMPRLFADQAMRATVDGSIALLQGGAVGGGSTVNWMLMLRTPDYVLDEWQRQHKITGLDAAVMGPAFERIEREVHARVAPDDAHSPSNHVILNGAAALGWRARAVANNAAGCVRAGTCSLGCRYDAKQSVLITFLPRALDAGARLYTSARVDRVELLAPVADGPRAAPRRKRVHATVRHPVTRALLGTIVAEAPIVILAAGAVETPAILQRSGFGGGGVGRYLRLHPTTAVIGRFRKETYPLAGVPQSAMCDEFIRRDANGYGFWIEVPALQPALAAVSLSGFGREHETLIGALGQVVPLILLVRDGSGDDASSGAVWVDRRGRVRVKYRLSTADRDNLRAGVEATARLQLAAGAEEVLTLHTPALRVRSERDLAAIGTARYEPNRIGLFSAHVNGTCRMGVNPSTSGTNLDGERHGVRGLYVLDGSLLPTSLGVNPQETIMALASVLSERIP